MVIAGLVSEGYSWEIASLIGVLVGLLFGVVNGVLIAYLGLASLITTIATGGIGIALAGAINQGSSLPIPQAENLGFLFAANIGPIPLLALLCAAVFLVTWFVQERLTLGHYIYAIAENREAVIEAGHSGRSHHHAALRLLCPLWKFRRLASDSRICHPVNLPLPRRFSSMD